MTGAAGGEDGWGPWTAHDGTGCPCLRFFVQIELEPPESWSFAGLYRREGMAGDRDMGGISVWEWSNWGMETPESGGRLCSRVLRYRIRRSASFEKLKRIAEAPATVRELEPA